jgi:hypothetical protein
LPHPSPPNACTAGELSCTARTVDELRWPRHWSLIVGVVTRREEACRREVATRRGKADAAFLTATRQEEVHCGSLRRRTPWVDLPILSSPRRGPLVAMDSSRLLEVEEEADM